MTQGFLTFASFQNDRRSGWSIGQQRGLSDAECTELIKVVPTVIDSPREIPKYPTRQEIAEMDRRVAVIDAPWNKKGVKGDKVFVYSTPVGEDATGRRGNVFSQVYLFRADDHGQRLTDFLGSESLLAPFGPQEVNSIPALDGQLKPGPYATPEHVWAWVFDENSVIDRAAVHRAVLSAVEYAWKKSTDQNIVAICCPREESFYWMSALFLSASPASLSHISWSTFERARNLSKATEVGFRVVCIPPEDYSVAEANPEVICVRTSVEPDLHASESADSFHLIAGTEIPVMEWEVLFEYQCVDVDSASAMSRSAVVSNEGKHPAWHLVCEAVMDDNMLRYLRNPIRGFVGRTVMPTNLSDEVVKKLLIEFGPSSIYARSFLDLASRLPKWNELATLGDEEIYRVVAKTDFLRRVYGYGDEFRGLTRQNSDVEAVLQKVVGEDSRLYERVSNAQGLEPDVAKWLGIEDLAFELSDRVLRTGSYRNYRAVDFVDALLISAWALGKTSSPKKEIQQPTFSGPGFRESSFDPQDTFVSSTLEQYWTAEESRAVAFALNSIETVLESEGPGWRVKLAAFESVVEIAKKQLSVEGKDVLALGIWGNVVPAETKEKAHDLMNPQEEIAVPGQEWGEDPSAVRAVPGTAVFANNDPTQQSPRIGSSAWELANRINTKADANINWRVPNTTRLPADVEATQSRYTEFAEIDWAAIGFTEKQMRWLSQATTRDIGREVDKEGIVPLFPSTEDRCYRISRFAGLLFAPMASSPIIESAFISVVCWAILEIDEQYRNNQVSYAELLPWWRLEGFDLETINRIAGRVAGRLAETETRNLSQEVEEVANLKIPGLADLLKAVSAELVMTQNRLKEY